MHCLNKKDNSISEGAGCDPAPFCGRYSCFYTFLFACLIVLAGMGLAGMLPGMKYRAVLTDTWDQMTDAEKSNYEFFKSLNEGAGAAE